MHTTSSSGPDPRPDADLAALDAETLAEYVATVAKYAGLLAEQTPTPAVAACGAFLDDEARRARALLARRPSHARLPARAPMARQSRSRARGRERRARCATRASSSSGDDPGGGEPPGEPDVDRRSR
jgi:hypothetical protein